MKLDTHVHLLVSKTAAPDWPEIRFTAEAARRDGLDVLCICEHLDAVHYPTLMRGLFDDLRLGGRILRPGILRLENGLVISAGAEVSLAGGGDVGVHAAPEVLLSLDRRKGAYTLAALLAELDRRGAERAMVAHHVYYGSKWIAELPAVGARLDAVELPAKDLGAADRYVALAGELRLPMVGGGDGHTWIQVGACFTDLQDEMLPDAAGFSPHAFRQALARRHVRPVPVAGADRFLRMSRLYRDRIEAAG